MTLRTHEELWLKEGYLLCLQFNEGWVVFRITGWEPSNITPYSLGAVAATANLASWNEILDSNADRYLEPQREQWINHFFWGINEPEARAYVQYATRQDRWSLTNSQRTITGDIGYANGRMSPYNGPFSSKTQMFTIHELYPAFQIYNPLPVAMPNVLMNFDIMRYSYIIIKDKNIIREALTLKRPARIYTVGGVDPNPVRIPEWLQSRVNKLELLEYSNTVMEEGR